MSDADPFDERKSAITVDVRFPLVTRMTPVGLDSTESRRRPIDEGRGPDARTTW